MKNYYLRRIDEFTQIGSDERPRAVSDLARGIGGAASYLRRKVRAPLETFKRVAKEKAKDKIEREQTAQDAAPHIDAMRNLGGEGKTDLPFSDAPNLSSGEEKDPDPGQPSSKKPRRRRRIWKKDRTQPEAKERQKQEARKERVAKVRQASQDKENDALDRGDLDTAFKELRRQDRLKKYEAIVYTQIGYILAESMGLIK